MKRFACFCLFSLAVLASCNKDSDDDITYDDPFYGKWIITEAFGDFADANEGTTYEFTESGTLTIEKGALFNEGTYVKNDTMITADLNGIEISYLYTLGDQRLELENTGIGNNQRFILERP